MTSFSVQYSDYVESASKADAYFGYDCQTLAKIERLLNFLFCDWWKVAIHNLERLPKFGPALVVGHNSGLIPWTGLMLLFALMRSKEQARKLNIIADMSWVADERFYAFLVQIGFVPYSANNLKHLFSKGEMAIIFPELNGGEDKTFSERYRLREFDWTQFLPAIQAQVPIFPLATLGADEAIPAFLNIEKLSKLLSLPAFPVTPFFPWLPSPVNLASFPVRWKMEVMKPLKYEMPETDNVEGRHDLEEMAKNLALQAEGEIQAELNRLLRLRIKSL